LKGYGCGSEICFENLTHKKVGYNEYTVNGRISRRGSHLLSCSKAKTLKPFILYTLFGVA